MSLVKCDNCGWLISDKASKCPHCKINTSTIICSECGNVVNSTYLMCPNCGNPIRSKEQTIEISKQQYEIVSNDFIGFFSIFTYICAGLNFIDLFVPYDVDTLIWDWFNMLCSEIQLTILAYWIYKLCVTMRMRTPSFSHEAYWVWLWLIIPIIFFYKPYQILTASWNIVAAKSKKYNRGNIYIIGWWVTYIIMYILMCWVLFSIFTLEEETSPMVDFILSIILILAYLFDVVVVRMFRDVEITTNV